MSEIIKETVRTKVGSTLPINKQDSEYDTVNGLIYFSIGLLDILLAFRLVFKLAGASQASAFVRFIYNLTQIFILPFEGIFRRGYTQGIETTSVLEPSTLVAILVYAILAWGLVKLIAIAAGKTNE